MVNRHRGEVSAILDGETYTLCLTLGALAEIEAQLGGVDILALAQRFESEGIGARDAIAVIGAGLRGGGHKIPDSELASMRIEGGVPAYLRLAADLLLAAFGLQGAPPGVAENSPSGGQANAPFPGGA